jgi:hypothetical protein
MKINILLPVYNDWESVNLLLKDIEAKLDLPLIDVTLINDFSTIDPVINKNFSKLKIIILNLKKNYGSQKAINIGLKYLNKNKINFDYCIVMDSDGEDKAEDVLRLLDKARKNNKNIIFASRGKRQDSFIFHFFYKIYLFFFFIFTGVNINCGNFSCIPQKKISEVINLRNSQIHHSASILSSNLFYKKIRCDRGKRFMGKSKMSLKNLILHGLNAMTLFLNIILLRFFIFFFSMSLVVFYWIKNSQIINIFLFLFIISILFLLCLKFLQLQSNKNIVDEVELIKKQDLK